MGIPLREKHPLQQLHSRREVGLFSRVCLFSGVGLFWTWNLRTCWCWMLCYQLFKLGQVFLLFGRVPHMMQSQLCSRLRDTSCINCSNRCSGVLLFNKEFLIAWQTANVTTLLLLQWHVMKLFVDYVVRVPVLVWTADNTEQWCLSVTIHSWEGGGCTFRSCG